MSEHKVNSKKMAIVILGIWVEIILAAYLPASAFSVFTEKTQAKTNHTKTTTASGVILALDKETGEKLWEYDDNAAMPQIGSSI